MLGARQARLFTWLCWSIFKLAQGIAHLGCVCGVIMFVLQCGVSCRADWERDVPVPCHERPHAAGAGQGCRGVHWENQQGGLWLCNCECSIVCCGSWRAAKNQLSEGALLSNVLSLSQAIILGKRWLCSNKPLVFLCEAALVIAGHVSSHSFLTVGQILSWAVAPELKTWESTRSFYCISRRCCSWAGRLLYRHLLLGVWFCFPTVPWESG